MNLSARIRIARRFAGLTQQGLAKCIGVTRGAVANWECNGANAPASRRLVRLAQATGVSFEWLATGRGGMNPLKKVAEGLQPRETDQHSRDEHRLLSAFRAMDPCDRVFTLEFAESRPRLRFHR